MNLEFLKRMHSICLGAANDSCETLEMLSSGPRKLSHHPRMIVGMEGGLVWSHTKVAVVSAAGWSRASIVEGQRELERLRREVDAAFAALVIADGGDDRDAVARVVRAVGVSGRCARERVRVARVCDAVPVAYEALAAGVLCSERVALLDPVIDDPSAAELVEVGVAQSPEEFRDTVMRYRLAKDPGDVRRRQREARGLTFFRGEHGCVGVRGMFTPVDGEEFRNRLTAIADANWRVEHPDRAPKRGAHGGDGWPARMADALMELIRGERGGVGGGGVKPTVVITVDAASLNAAVVGEGPIALSDALEVAARGELYAAVRGMSGEILNLGRSKRFASAIQNLALIVRDQKCVVPGCDGHWCRTEAHHIIEFTEGGRTDLANLARMCEAHHHWLHVNKLRLVKRDGVWVVEAKARSQPNPDTG